MRWHVSPAEIDLGKRGLAPEPSPPRNSFYVGAKIELVKTGQWATIQHYNGYLRMALFGAWQKPYGRETESTLVRARPV